MNSYCKVITNQRYWVSKTNDLLTAGFYNFGADGKMTDAPIPTPDPDPNPNPDPEVKNGIVSEDGELYYYVNGVKTYAGLIQIDGNYYYVNSYCKVITNQRYWVSKTCLLYTSLIGDDSSEVVGSLTDDTGTQRNVYLHVDELPADSGLEETEQTRFYAMQEDLNYLIDNLK